MEAHDDGGSDHTASERQPRVEDVEDPFRNTRKRRITIEAPFVPSIQAPISDSDQEFKRSREPLRSRYRNLSPIYHRPPLRSQSRSRSRSQPRSRPRSRSRSRSQARLEYPEAGSIYDVESERDDMVDIKEPLPPGPEWVQPKTVLEDGGATELLVAHSIEHRVFRSLPEKIVLIGPSGPPPSSPPSRGIAQEPFRWL